MNGITRAFAQTIVKSIDVDTFAGSDHVAIDSGVMGTYVDGGDGE